MIEEMWLASDELKGMEAPSVMAFSAMSSEVNWRMASRDRASLHFGLLWTEE
jgi:hypothetical protein